MNKRIIGYSVSFLAGILVTFIVTKYQIIGPQAANYAKTNGQLFLTYSDFISIMLTCVTIVLGAVAIGIGIVAFRTVKDMKEDARAAVRDEMEKEAKSFRIEMQAEIANYRKDIYRGVGASGGGELESDFDPNDTEER